MIKSLGITAVIIFILNAISIGGHPQIGLETYAQTNSMVETKKQPVVANTTQEQQATIIVTKIVRCDSSLGIPSDDSVCQFVLENVDANQFNLVVTGNNPNMTSFQGSANGTNISLDPGNYTISETAFDTMNIENQLGETAIVTVLTDSNGDCSSQFNQVDVFQEAIGRISNSELQSCEIVNTIDVSQGASPEAS
ncbi:MAG TPA: hypothetical protein VJL78_05975 [Candidatus Nitrosocosmicus sp.]|nr:hypothetical protein [Candidatus Nitrosocosmicus sp.]